MQGTRDPEPFQYAPRSVNAAATAPWAPSSMSSPLLPAEAPTAAQMGDMQNRQRKRRRARHRPILPMASASSSSWGAHDQDVEDEGELPTSSSENDDDEDNEQRHERSQAAPLSNDAPPPRKKRPHLAADDVGRFANMSINLGPKRAMTEQSPSNITSPTLPSVPQAPPSSPNRPWEPVLQQAAPLAPTSIEEPSEERRSSMDSEMRARRGPSSYEIDKGRFYVTSLSDSSSDEEGESEEQKKRREHVNQALATGRPLEQRAVDSAVNGDDVVYTVNGELISRLEALESQRRAALARDRTEARMLRRRKPRGGRGSATSSGTSTPTATSEDPGGALILWRSPQEVLEHGSSAMAFNATTDTPADEPLIVTDEGNFAYVKRPSAVTPDPTPVVSPTKASSDTLPSYRGSPNPAFQPPDHGSDAMDLDE